MQRNHRILAALLVPAFFVTTLAAPLSARASEEGKRNTAIGLGAGAAALLLGSKNKLPGLLAAGGAVYAYSQYERDINRRHQRERIAAYHRGLRRGESYAHYHRTHRTRRHYHHYSG